jgi:hypothetical protein
MAVSKYQKFGLRRERNLSDVQDKKEALSSLLDDFTSPKGQLIADDILVISGLQDTAITQGKITQLNGQIRQFLPTNAETGIAGALQNAIPLETINDKIENLKVVLGEPPFATGGGDGLRATFYKIENVKPEAEITGSTTGDQLLKSPLPNPNGIAGPVDFWDNGRFLFGTTLHPDFDDQYGLVQWEGYYSGKESFYVETTGLYLIEYNFEDGTGWQTLKSIYNKDRILTAPGSATNTTIIVLNDLIKHVNINDTVTGDTGTGTVTEINTASGWIRLDSPISVAQGNNIVVSTDIGSRITRSETINFPLTFFGGKLKVRFTVWFPYNEQGIFYTRKSFDLEIIGNNIENFPYNFFYSDFDPNRIPGRETFEHFRENSLSERNITIDKEFTARGLFSVEYYPLIFSNALAAAPSEGQVLKSVNAGQPMTLTRIGATLMQLDGTPNVIYNGGFSPYYEWVEEGWWVIKCSPTNGQDTWFADQVLEKLNSDRQFYVHDDSPFLSIGAGVPLDCLTPSESFVLANPKDVIAFARASVDGSGNWSFESIDGPRVPDIRKNLLYRKDLLVHLVYPEETTTPTYPKRLASIDVDNNTFTFETDNGNNPLARVVSQDTTTLPTNKSDILVVFTSSAGLEEAGRIQFCEGTYGKIVTQSATVGDTRIYVNDTTGIFANASTGDWVQFGHNPAKVQAINDTSPGTIVPDTTYTSQYLPPLTYVTAIGDDPTFGPYIDINNTVGNAIPGPIGPYAAGLPAFDLPASGTLVFIKRGNAGIIDGNGFFIAREFCVMPLDTAPPFEGTAAGLSTPTSYSNLVVQDLKFTDFEFSTSNATAIAAGSTLTAGASLSFTNEWFDTTSGSPVFTSENFKFLIEN